MARPLRGGKPRPVRPHEKRRIPRRGQGAARQDRHGAPQHALPRPDHVPHHPCRASPHGQQVVHLPDVRLCPRPERLDRADHPLDLHARIRRAPSSLRLVHPGAGDLPFAPVRIRPAEPHLHDDVEAQAAQTRAGRRRDGLGRPPHADDLRFAPQGLYPGLGAELRRDGGRRQARQRDRPGQARILRARRPEQDRRAPHGSAQPAEGGHHQLRGRQDRALHGDQQPRGRIGRHAAGALLEGHLHRARRFHGGASQKVLPPGTRRRGAPALFVPDQVRGGHQGCRGQHHRAALHL